MSSKLSSTAVQIRTLRSHASARLRECKRLESSTIDSSPTDDSDKWVVCEGDDVMTAQVIERHQAWLQIQQVTRHSTLPFKDDGFMPGPKAVDGREEIDARKDIFKATLSDIAGPSQQQIAEPLCLCGRPARTARIQKGVATGRSVWRCASRACNYFELVDRASTIAALELTWKGLGSPEWVVVGDEGFRPEDLRQGAVGDCWFMSALAVVAERHDLVEKLLPGLNEGLESGCHEVRLFLDGRWTAALVDNYFALADPTKQKRQDETGLAFGRASGHQLWVPLLEKAYARAHGSYNSISGGQVSEAMLDLTGCPTESVNFKIPGFDKEFFWARLLSFLDAGFPIGCGTNAETAEELGLVGQHAYSVLDVSDHETRLVKVRNPWGEWTRREYDEILQSLGAAITADGAFWMPYDDFIRGFAGVEVCKARSGWHARSFEVGFSSNSGTGFRKVLYLQALTRTECYIMVIQPTDRGAKLKRSNDYVLNDASYAVLDAETEGLNLMQFGGARRDVTGDSIFFEPGQKYMIVPFSFKARQGGCVVRLFSSDPLKVRTTDAHAAISSSLWTAMHSFSLQHMDVLACRVQRMMHRIFSESSGRQVGRLIVLEGEAMAVGIVINELLNESVHVTTVLQANQMVARSASGISTGSPRQLSLQNSQITVGKGKSKGKKAGKEDWHEFEVSDVVPPSSQQLIFAMIPSTRQHGSFDLSIVEMRARESSSGDHETHVRRALHHPFSPRPAKDILFGPQELKRLDWTPDGGCEDADLLAALSASLEHGPDEAATVEQASRKEERMQPPLDDEREDEDLLAALSASLEHCPEEVARLAQALQTGERMQPLVATELAINMGENGEEHEMALAIALSLQESCIEKPDVVQCQSHSTSMKPRGRWNRHRMSDQ